jgi:hypothetical protein
MEICNVFYLNLKNREARQNFNVFGRGMLQSTLATPKPYMPSIAAIKHVSPVVFLGTEYAVDWRQTCGEVTSRTHKCLSYARNVRNIFEGR